MTHTMTHRRLGQRGFTLIEILVSILIFSFGLLGFVGLQARAIQFSVGAEDSNRASLLANEMAATMVLKNTADVSKLTSEIAAWQTRANDPEFGPPNAFVAVANAATGASAATLTITWKSPGVTTGAANSTSKYVTQVVLP